MANSTNSLNIKSAGIPVFDGIATFTESTTTQYNVLVGGSSNAIGNVVPSATAGVPLISQGSSANPAFGTAVVGGGGTGATTLTAHGVLIGNGTSAISVTAVGTTGQVLTGVTGSDPVWAAAASGITTLNGDTGSATGSTVTIAGGSNITTSAASSTVTVDLDSTVSISGSMTAGTGFTATTGDVQITAGNLLFPNGSTSTSAMISRIGGTRLLSFLGSGNVFLGANAGNVTFVGANSNIAVGDGALTSLTNGDENVGIGLGAAADVTTGTGNTCVGYTAGSNVITGGSNTLIGHAAGANYTSSEANNICIGSGVLGTNGESNVIRVGNTSSNTSFFAAGVQGVTPSGTTNVVLINSSGQLGSSVGTNGQLLIGSTGASPAWATLTAGTGISVTNGANSITVAATGSGAFTWSEQTGTTQAMAVNHGYILNNAGLVTATLPATAAVGDIMEIVGKGAGGWTLAQNSGQTVHFGNQDTTTGATGSLSSTNRYDCLQIICTVANTDFTIKGSIGNITVA